MMNERVYIIVLNWNGTNDTIECMKSVKNNNYNNYTIVLVDNGSDKDSLLELMDWCRNNFSKIALYNRTQAELGGINKIEEELENLNSNDKLIFIENNENLGFAAGNNVALKYVLKRNSPYAMLLNNDTVIEKDSINILINFLKSHDEYVAVTPQIRYFKPNNKIWNCGGKITWFGNRRYFHAGDHISKVPQTGFMRITFITGCALLFKPNCTGLLTEKFFFGEEDFDFSFRQKKENKKMACCFSSIIYHKVSSSIKKIDSNILGSIYLHYISRIINNRQYSSKNMLNLKIIVNLFYAIPMLRFKYKIEFKRILRMFMTMHTELKVIDNVDKNYCLKYLNEDFISR